MTRVKIKYKFFGTAAEGTRQVFTWTEILTETTIEEYVNDERIDQRENPIGVIPVVHIPNATLNGSPWGLSDLKDLTALNREYNEKSEAISDIINYHCVDGETEILTVDGWKNHSDLTTADTVLGRDADSNEIIWQPVEAVNVFPHEGPLTRWTNQIDALTTPEHRWIVDRLIGRSENVRYSREFARTLTAAGDDKAVGDLRTGSRVVLGGGTPAHFPTEAKYTDEFVETIGWLVTEGWVGRTGTSARNVSILSQSESKNPQHVTTIRRLQAYWKRLGATFTEQRKRPNGVICWYLGTDLTETLCAAAPNKALTPAFLAALTHMQATNLLQTLIDADGTRKGEGAPVWYQDDVQRIDGFQMLCAMLGERTHARMSGVGNSQTVNLFTKHDIWAKYAHEGAVSEDNTSGVVWCPTVPTGTWFARRGGYTYWTGNSEPTTIVTGAKADNLTRGAGNMWHGLPSDAKVFNLQLDSNLGGPVGYLEMLKRSMHEMTGIPENALGQSQAISNTSGVALQMQYMPLMNKRARKIAQYAKGLREVNALILRTLAVKEPQAFTFDPSVSADLDSGQLPQLDPRDPLVYQTEVDFPDPLPLDRFLKLRELQALMEMGLESKRGAMAALGEEFPDEKIEEIIGELREDVLEEGTLNMLQTDIQQATIARYGMLPVEQDGGASAQAQADPDQPSEGGTERPAGPGRPPSNPLNDILGQHIADMQSEAYGVRGNIRANPENAASSPNS